MLLTEKYAAPIRRALMHFVIFYTLYFVSVYLDEIAKSWPQGEYFNFYLVGWTSANSYMYVWVPAIAFALFNVNVWAWCITGSNLLGVLVGETLGDYLEYQIIRPIEGGYHTGFHAAFQIWICTVLAGIVIGGLGELLAYLVRRVKQNA